VSFGDGSERSWEEARQYGFISAGGGSWYTRTLNMLNLGDRIWVNVPGVGYVGVGRVSGSPAPASDLQFSSNGITAPATELLRAAHYHADFSDDQDQREYFVPVTWLETVPISQAFSDTGLFGNQNTVCKPTTPKWRQTVDRLKVFFPHWDDDK
jgi:hypothetical protein